MARRALPDIAHALRKAIASDSGSPEVLVKPTFRSNTISLTSPAPFVITGIPLERLAWNLKGIVPRKI